MAGLTPTVPRLTCRLVSLGAAEAGVGAGPGAGAGACTRTLKFSPVYLPPLSARQVAIRLPNGMTVEVTNNCYDARAWSLV